MAEHNRIGQLGEQLAADLLKRKGYKILATNWKFRHLEIDIIAATKKEIAFVEVKTRTSTFGGRPENAVNATKKRRLAAAAKAYLSYNNESRNPRFDVVSILLNPNGEIEEIQHFEKAFQSQPTYRAITSFLGKWRWFSRD